MKKEIVLFGNYFSNFLKKLSKEEVLSIKKALGLFLEIDILPYHFVKYIRDGIYEFRVSCRNNAFRIFFIYDGNEIVVLFNGFKKKTQKTPNREIEKAIKLKKQYYLEKSN